MLAADFISFADRMDRCWMEGRLPELAEFLADDVVFVAPGGSPRIEGVAQAIESYRQFTSEAQIKHFETRRHFVTERGDTAVIEYAWQMTWISGEEHNESGREVLVLAQRNQNWRVVWRAQLPVHPPSS